MEAEVPISPNHVGHHVVGRVVRPLPALCRCEDVPFVVSGVQLGIVHEVVLSMQDVVADLHVLEALVGPEREHPRPPADGLQAEVDEEAARGSQALGGRSHRRDVFRVALADLRCVLSSQPIELLCE